MKADLLRDLDEEETNEQSMLGQHEDLWMEVDPQITQMRREAEFLAQQIEEVKSDYSGGRIPDAESV